MVLSRSPRTKGAVSALRSHPRTSWCDSIAVHDLAPDASPLTHTPVLSHAQTDTEETGRRRRRGAPTGWWRAATWIEPWPSGAAERPSPSPHVRGRAPAARCRLVWRCDTRNRIVCLVIRSMAIRGEIRALGFYSHSILKHVRGGSLSILFLASRINSRIKVLDYTHCYLSSYKAFSHLLRFNLKDLAKKMRI
jgi:hypothetical protein